MRRSDEPDDRLYTVLVNDKRQHSLWLEYKDVPSGWTRLDFTGSEEECMAYVDEVGYVGPKRSI